MEQASMLPLLFSFGFLFCLLFANYGFWLAFFTVWTALDIDQLISYTASWMCGLEGKFRQECKERASNDEVKSSN
jgi:hypothetical protein